MAHRIRDEEIDNEINEKREDTKLEVVAVDIDDTLLDGKTKEPIQENVDKVNEIYNGRDTMVIIYTSRPEMLREITVKQLFEAGVQYHALVMGKLRASKFIDDRSENWSN